VADKKFQSQQMVNTQLELLYDLQITTMNYACEAFFINVLIMCGTGDAVKLVTFVLNCQLFRTKVHFFNSKFTSSCARFKQHQTTKTKLLPTPPTMATLILAQHNNKPTIPRH
jgi:hypothetical protein